MKKLKPKAVRAIVWTIFAVGAVFGWMGVVSKATPLTIVGVVILLCAVVFHYILYRCPHCGGFLDRSTGDFCPHCGEKLNQ